jgi:hypothetical protein
MSLGTIYFWKNRKPNQLQILNPYKYFGSYIGSRDNAVGIATGYGLSDRGGSEFEFR